VTLKIVSWNIEGRLSAFSKDGRGTPTHILAGIREQSADIVLLVEAFDQAMGIAPHGTLALEALGYTSYDVPYNDAGPERINPALSRPVMRLLSRVPVEDIQHIRLGNLRNALIAKVTDLQTGQRIRLIGIHLDDRAESLRLEQLSDLIPIINNSELPTVMMGDYNAMHAEGVMAKLLRSWPIRVFARCLPTPSLRDFSKRAIGMAAGTTMSAIVSETNLHDVDRRHRPTATPKVRQHSWLPSIRMLDLDHMLVSDTILVSDFVIAKHDGGSDHRAISAHIALK
jgi:endonuclease/exonuclease/phosphatase family metal-dependent hydrolase